MGGGGGGGGGGCGGGGGGREWLGGGGGYLCHRYSPIVAVNHVTCQHAAEPHRRHRHTRFPTFFDTLYPTLQSAARVSLDISPHQAFGNRS